MSLPNIDMLVEAGVRFGVLLGVQAPDEASVRAVILRTLDEREVVALARAGIITEEEAMMLLLAHVHSRAFSTMNAAPGREPWNDEVVRDLVRRGLFGDLPITD